MKSVAVLWFRGFLALEASKGAFGDDTRPATVVVKTMGGSLPAGRWEKSVGWLSAVRGNYWKKYIEISVAMVEGVGGGDNSPTE